MRCSRCGLVDLKNEATRRAKKAHCPADILHAEDNDDDTDFVFRKEKN